MTFPCRYPGQCPACLRMFHPGEDIGYSGDGELLCNSCLADDGGGGDAMPVCPACHLQHAGECF